VRLFISEKSNWFLINFVLQIDTAKIISDGAALFLVNLYVLYWPGFSASVSAAQQSIIKRSARVVCRVYAFDFYSVKGISYIYWGISAIYHSFPAFLRSSQWNGMVLYLWLIKGATQGRKNLRLILAHLSNMGLVSLGAAILGAISRVMGHCTWGMFSTFWVHVTKELTQIRSNLSFVLCGPHKVRSLRNVQQRAPCTSVESN
jgi:hypothetical protein